MSAATAERPHRLKYRLNYCTSDGATLVRYDNERGKGDHKHVAGQQAAYKFKSIRQLAKNLGRDYSVVHGDVKTLLELGLPATDNDKKIHVPWDELAIELPLGDFRQAV